MVGQSPRREFSQAWNGPNRASISDSRREVLWVKLPAEAVADGGVCGARPCDTGALRGGAVTQRDHLT